MSGFSSRLGVLAHALLAPWASRWCLRRCPGPRNFSQWCWLCRWSSGGLCGAISPRGGTGQATQVTVLDVGQGTSVVVRSGDRRWFMIPEAVIPGLNMGSMAVLPYLQHQGIDSLDTLVISHPDLDHSAGTAVMLAALDCQDFATAGKVRARRGTTLPRGRILALARRAGFSVSSPGGAGADNSNDSSCVLQVQVGDYRILLPGDVEKGASDWCSTGARSSEVIGCWPPTTAAEHHPPWRCSSGTTKAAVISSGYANRFGHPHPLVIQRLRAAAYSPPPPTAHWNSKWCPDSHSMIDAFRVQQQRYWM